jgi:cytochrome c-type biogenesis protein CcsB
MKKWISLLLGLACVLPAYAEKQDVSEASRIVIQSGGRQKPLDTFGSEVLQTVTGRRTVADPETGVRLSPTDAMLSIWFAKRNWSEAQIVLVSDPDVRKELGLERRRQFSFTELMANRRLAEHFHSIQNKRAANEDLTQLEDEISAVLHRMNLLNLVMSGDAFTIVPHPDNASRPWMTPLMAVEVYPPDTAIELVGKLRDFSDTYLAGDAAAFVAASRDLRLALRDLAPGIDYLTAAAVGRELHYNNLHPFRISWFVYLGAFLLLLPRRTYKIGMALFTIGFLVNCYGFALRAWIAERAPVTNMYETVVWTALSIAMFALILEWIYKARIYALCAAPLAVLTLILADLFPTVLNPNINPLPPVLRDNFWLVTHVVTIMLGYAAFALALAMAHYILGRYVLKPDSINERSDVHFLLYRVLQLGILFLAAGTILGGVWANYSWGRFWGWDPKETWALIALLLYIFASHGKIAGWWGNFGMAVAAALCFNGVLMAWFGVNFVLGAGLHSYGFGTGGVEWVGLIVAIDALFVGFCVVVRMRRLHAMKRLGISAAPASTANGCDVRSAENSVASLSRSQFTSTDPVRKDIG